MRCHRHVMAISGVPSTLGCFMKPIAYLDYFDAIAGSGPALRSLYYPSGQYLGSTNPQLAAVG